MGGFGTGRLSDGPTALQVGEDAHARSFLPGHGARTHHVGAGDCLGAVLLGSAVASALDTGARAAGSASSGAVNAATSAVNPYNVDTLFRAAHPEANGLASNTGPEAARILGHAVSAGQMPAADRTYLAQLVAARSGLSQEEAQQRVDIVMTQAREAADAARKASAMTSIYIALSMLIGAFIAGVAAAMGGRVRDTHP